VLEAGKFYMSGACRNSLLRAYRLAVFHGVPVYIESTGKKFRTHTSLGGTLRRGEFK
jgi:hypothetical protein